MYFMKGTLMGILYHHLNWDGGHFISWCFSNFTGHPIALKPTINKANCTGLAQTSHQKCHQNTVFNSHFTIKVFWGLTGCRKWQKDEWWCRLTCYMLQRREYQYTPGSWHYILHKEYQYPDTPIETHRLLYMHHSTIAVSIYYSPLCKRKK